MLLLEYKNHVPNAKKGLIFDVWGADEGLVIFKTIIEKLPLFQIMGAFKISPDMKGEWIRDKERRQAQVSETLRLIKH